MAQVILLNKPYDMLSQFTDGDGRRTLADCISLPGFYAAGRLDRDSEGLLLLTDNGRLQQAIAEPGKRMGKVYWAQVEGDIDEEALAKLSKGMLLKDGMTRPARARKMAEPLVWSRNPPIRERRNIPTSWVELTLFEGRNRQVRRMTAAAGFPTLRLIRYSIGPWSLGNLQPGESVLQTVTPQQLQQSLLPA